MTPRQRKLRAWGAGIFAAVALYALLGFFLLPYVARKQIVQRGSAALQRDVTVGKMTFNPFTFAAELRQIRIAGTGETALATAVAATLNFNPLKSLVRWQWRFGDATLVSPEVHLAFDEQGRFNLTDLAPTGGEGGGPPSIGIERLTLSNGRVEFVDRSRAKPFETSLAPVDFTLIDFSTAPDESGNYRLTGTTASNRSFSWRGTLATTPFTSRGHMSFDGLNIPTYMPLLAEYLPITVRSGRLTIDGDYDVLMGDAQHATLSNFTVQATELVLVLPEADSPVVELPSATVEVRQAQLFERSAQLARVAIEGLLVRLERESDGTFNLTRLLPPSASPGTKVATSGDSGNSATASKEETKNGFVVTIDEVAVKNGTVRYVDRTLSEPFETTVKPLDLTMTGLSTDPGDSGGTYRLAGETDNGAAFVLDGTVSLTPLTSRGTLSLEQINLPFYRPYFAELITGDLRSGQVALKGSYDVSLGEDRHATLSDTTLQGTDLALAMTDAKSPAVELPSLTVDLSQAQLFEASAQIARVVLDGLFVRLQRESDGTIDLARLVSGATSAGSETAESGESKPAESQGTDVSVGAAKRAIPAVRVETFVVRNGAVEFIDQTTPEPATLRAEQIQFTATGASADLSENVGVDLAFQWAGGPGTVSVRGTVQPLPLAANLQVVGENLELPPTAPYLQQVMAARLLAGRASLDGRFKASQLANGPLAFHWEGQAAVDDLDMRDLPHEHELLRWRQLGLADFVLTTAPLGFTAREVSLRGASVHVVRLKDGSINVTQIVKDQGSESSDNDATTESGKPLPSAASIASLLIDGARVTFKDQGVDPEFVAALTSLEGAVLGLSTAPDASAQIHLTGTLAGVAPLTVSGKINLLAENIFAGTRITADLSNLPLQPFEPYAERYLGYQIERGRLRGDFVYTVTDEKLDGSNRIVLDEFALGRSVESPDAVSAPVKLAIAVLRNRKDEVVLNVPVSGSLKSPEFSLSSVIQSAFSSVLAKVVTAPLSLLGSMFGADEEDLGQAEFLPGEALLQDSTKERLNTLVNALNDRPGLALVINWRPTETVDRDVVKEKRLQQLIQQKREQIAGGPLTPQSTVTEAEGIRALARGRFPELAAEVADAGQGSGESRDPWYKRLFNSIFGRDRLAGQSEDESATASANAELAQLRNQLIANLSMDPSEYRELARNRAVTARDHLIAAGIDPHRVDIAPQPLPEEPPRTGADRALIYFELRPASAPPAPRPSVQAANGQARHSATGSTPQPPTSATSP